MKQYILKNDTQENVSARVTVTPSDELANLGHEGATVIEGDRLTTCLSPTVNEMLPPVSHRSACFELSEEGRYAVEINGVIVPFAFTATDLLDCFNGTHESGVRFKPCAVKPEISCAGATDRAFLTDGSGVWDVELNGKLFVNPGDLGAGYFIIQTPELSNEIVIGGDGNAVITNISQTTFNRVRLFPRDSSRWGIAATNENPTLAVDGDGVISVCLSPVPLKISCDGATDTSGCINLTGKWDLEVDGEIWASKKTPDEIAALLVQSGDFTLDASCHDCLSGVCRSIRLPYSNLKVGDVFYLPIALTENGESITTPITVGNTPSIANNITDQLNAQLEPHGLYAMYGVMAGTSITVGIPDNRARDYKETIFYVLDEGNTFTPAQIPRGLPSFYCWMPT